MPKARKTKAGTWRVTIYDYKDSKGKVHQKTFTANTRREAERMAAEYKMKPKIEDMTIGEAVSSYIKVKEAALSPATVREYKQISKNNFESSRFGSIYLTRLDTATVQRFISDLVEDGKSPKTVRNIYGLMVSAVRMYRPGCMFPVTLPAPKKPELYTPSSDEVNRLIAVVKGNRELYIVVLLCAFGPMRRSEACAIMYSDIDKKKNMITVRRARVKDDNKQYVYKDLPKNYSSYRSIIYPENVINAIGRGIGYVINKNPDVISRLFDNALKDAGLPHFRLHDLRHYAASILHAIGIPDQYIMSRGGWKTDHVMKRVYRDTISDVEKEMNDRINDYFSRVI